MEWNESVATGCTGRKELRITFSVQVGHHRLGHNVCMRRVGMRTGWTISQVGNTKAGSEASVFQNKTGNLTNVSYLS